MSKRKNAAVTAALVGNCLVAAAKFTAALITGSAAMLAESLHSLADTGNQVLLLVGISRSRRPADTEHPFGYGKERFFWAFLVAVTMFFVGAVMSVYKGVEGIFYPHPLEKPLVNYSVLALSVFFEGFALRTAYREFKQHRRAGLLRDLHEAKDPSTLTILFEDSAALTGIAVAALGIFLSRELDNPFYDALASVIIGLVLAVVAFFLARETKALLIGESASRYDRERIADAVRQVPEVSALMDLLTMHIGPDEILVNLNINFKDGLDTDRLELVIDEVEKRIRQAVPEVGRIFIEAETLRRAKGLGKNVQQEREIF